MAKKRPSASDRPPELETSASFQTHPSPAELTAIGKLLRDKSPRESHGAWKPPHHRPSPLRTEGNLGRNFYIRQLKDVKVKPLVEIFETNLMTAYAELCGWTLARAHARTGEPAKISGYLGKGEAFDEAVADFSIAYADQTERDHETLTQAVRDGRLEVFVEAT